MRLKEARPELAQLKQTRIENGDQPLWSIVVGDRTISSSFNQNQAVDYACLLIGCTTASLWQVTEDQLQDYDSRPLSFQQAKNVIQATTFWIKEKQLQTAVEIVDSDCVEYDWGWLMHWAPTEPYSPTARWVDEYHFPTLIDRVTARTQPHGTRGLPFAVIMLLRHRMHQPQNIYPILSDWRDWHSMVEPYERLGAFMPINELA